MEKALPAAHPFELVFHPTRSAPPRSWYDSKQGVYDNIELNRPAPCFDPPHRPVLSPTGFNLDSCKPVLSWTLQLCLQCHRIPSQNFASKQLITSRSLGGFLFDMYFTAESTVPALSLPKNTPSASFSFGPWRCLSRNGKKQKMKV